MEAADLARPPRRFSGKSSRLKLGALCYAIPSNVSHYAPPPRGARGTQWAKETRQRERAQWPPVLRTTARGDARQAASGGAHWARSSSWSKQTAASDWLGAELTWQLS